MNEMGFLKLKRAAALLFFAALIAVLIPPLSSRGSGEGKTVRVGWYESAFHRTDSFGRKSGYGYEYQQRVSAYTGWNFEYVEGSWSELFEMLCAGEIDLLTDVSYTAERAEKILYSSESMGSEDYHAFIAPDNTEIRPDDFSTFNGKRVGVNKNSIQEQLFIEWAENHNVYPEIVEMSVKSPEMIELLKQGEIDVLVTLDAYGSTSDMVPVCKTGSSNIYFGISMNRPDLKAELDVAMNRLLEENRYFNQQLAEKYKDGQGINDFLSSDETAWLSSHKTIRVGYQTNFLPFCDLDPATGEVTGALKDYLEEAVDIEKNARLDFTTVPFVTVEDALIALAKNEVDCVFPVSFSVFDGEQRGILVTEPLIKTAMFAAVRTADRRGISKDQPMLVSVTAGNQNYETFLRDSFPDWDVAVYNDTESGFSAVASGDADCALISNYRLSLLDEICSRYNLSTLATGEDMKLCFCVRRADDCLFSIINKVNHLIPESKVNSYLTNYSFNSERVTFGDFLRDNLVYVLVVAGIIVIIILLFVFQYVRTQRRSSERRRIISKTERDRLTNLYNRDFFFVYVNRRYLAQPDFPMDAIVINIERFHSVNSLNGREFGDEVLRVLGTAVSVVANECDGIAGRFESDRFDIYCPHRYEYQSILDRLQKAIDSNFPNSDIRLRMGVMPWQEGMEPELMFDLARSACSMIRGNYNKHLMVYDAEMRRKDQLNQRLQNDLGRAIEDHELEVYYQPKFDIRPAKARLNSAEALIRWNHPELGLLMPSDFILLFEQSGQISALDKYVWEESGKQIAAWKKQYGVVIPVSVNLSRVDVFDADLTQILEKIIKDNGLERKDLQLEITESAYTENAEQVIRVIRELRERGYEIEMDDFGSGYSSLNMLSSMPVDYLKMDREFIRNIETDPKDVRLVQLILDIGRNLRLPVIAEGVETEGQLQLLRKLGCPIVQGFYFSRPLQAKEFEKKYLL